MRKIIYLFIFAFLFLGFKFVSADVMSMNSGGSDNLIINPDFYVEGFFSGEVNIPPVCGNDVIESGEACDDGNVVDGDGCSSTCQIEGGGSEGGSDSGSDSGEIVIVPTTQFVVSPLEINLNLVTNTNREQLIVIRSNVNYTLNLTLGQSNLDNMLILGETQIVLKPGEVKEVRAIFVALGETGIFTGKVYVGGKAIPVTLNVKTKLLLFDSNIIVLNKDYLVKQGDKLRTSVTLIPMGDPERLDVTLNYVIKDYDGRLYLTRSETVLVEDQVNFKRNFDTGVLPVGEYIVGLELVYPNGVAPSSAHFEVIESGPNTLFGRIVFFLLNAILIVLILLIIVVIIRLFKRIKENKEYEEKYGKIPSKERRTLFFNKGKAKPFPPTKEEIKPQKITEKPIPEKASKQSSVPKVDSSNKTNKKSEAKTSSGGLVNIGSFPGNKKSKKT